MVLQEIEYPLRRFERLVEVAKALISKPEGREKHFTFIMKGSKVVSIGFNNVFTARVKIDGKYEIYPFGGVHSEADAIANLRCLDNTNRLTVVNLRINTFGQLGLSKPCEVCKGFLARFGFRTVYFSTRTGFDRLWAS